MTHKEPLLQPFRSGRGSLGTVAALALLIVFAGKLIPSEKPNNLLLR